MGDLNEYWEAGNQRGVVIDLVIKESYLSACRRRN